MSEELELEPLLLHEDTFYEFFVPYRHPKSQSNVWGEIGLDTCGEDFQLVRSLDDNYVWTVVEDGIRADQWITSGIHYVNRICYLVTEKPHNGLMVDFLAPHNLRSLTPLGLKRQIRKLEKALARINR